MDILILGGAGMLGHKLFQRLRQSHPETFCTLRGSVNEDTLQRVELFHAGNVIANCDASDFSAVERLLLQHKPAVVINCIGIVKQRAEAKKPIPSIEINSLLPHRLASVCEAWRGRFIHFSTDCVFDGQAGNYSEEDFADARDLLRRMERLSAIAILAPPAASLYEPPRARHPLPPELRKTLARAFGALPLTRT